MRRAGLEEGQGILIGPVVGDLAALTPRFSEPGNWRLRGSFLLQTVTVTAALSEILGIKQAPIRGILWLLQPVRQVEVVVQPYSAQLGDPVLRVA